MPIFCIHVAFAKKSAYFMTNSMKIAIKTIIHSFPMFYWFPFSVSLFNGGLCQLYAFSEGWTILNIQTEHGNYRLFKTYSYIEN